MFFNLWSHGRRFIWLVIRLVITLLLGSRDGAVVRALASHQCAPCSIAGVDAISGLSLLLVLVLPPRVFLRVLRFSSLHKHQHFQIPIRPGTHGHLLNEFLEFFGASWVNKLHLQQSALNYSNKRMRTDLALVHVTVRPSRDVLCRVWFLHCTLCTEPVKTTETNALNKFTNNKTTKTDTLNTAWK